MGDFLLTNTKWGDCTLEAEYPVPDKHKCLDNSHRGKRRITGVLNCIHFRHVIDAVPEGSFKPQWIVVLGICQDRSLHSFLRITGCPG